MSTAPSRLITRTTALLFATALVCAVGACSATPPGDMLDLGPGATHGAYPPVPPGPGDGTPDATVGGGDGSPAP
jgi:hypothetical protein